MDIGKPIRRIYRRLKSEAYYRKNRNKLSLRKSDYDHLKKLGPNIKSLQTAFFNGHKISFTSPFWFLHSLDEIFVQEVYKFPEMASPVIIDCGANIGLSVIYFKTLFKDARITAFEADPQVFGQLKLNVSEYNYEDVTLINRAVWKEETTLSFLSEGSVGGMLELESAKGHSRVEVATIRLKDYLTTPVDFLKIDIEGAEYEVLKDCRDVLGNVGNLFIEYHVFPNQAQTLHEMLAWVNEAGFKYYIKEAWNNMSYPFMNNPSYYQMQLNIFCYRQEATITKT